MGREQVSPRLPGITAMVAHASREVVLPGVGVYNPRQRRLEGEVNRLRGLNIRQSVERLTVNVHQPEDLVDALSAPKMGSLKECRVNYIKSYGFASLKRALETAAFNPERLRLFRVTGSGVAHPWQVETLRALFKCLSGAKLSIFDRIAHPFKVGRDEVVTAGDGEWCRLYGDTVALYSVNLPWFEDLIRERCPKRLIVDCDDQFHLQSLAGGILSDGSVQLERLVLHNVSTTSIYLLKFLETINVPGLQRIEMTSSDPLMQNNWIKAATMYVRTKPNLRGVGFWFNGDCRA